MSEDLSGFSLIELFRMEAESHTATLSTGLIALEGQTALPATIEPLMRAAHSLKGAARVVGLDPAVRIAHALEDCFVAAQRGAIVLASESVDVMLRGVDWLSRISNLAESELEAWQAENAGAIDALVAELGLVREGRYQAATPVFTPAPASPVAASPAPTPQVAPDPAPVALPTPSSSEITIAPKAAVINVHREPTRAPDHDRVVRVSADSLNRLTGLAGEAVVQTHRLRPLVDALWRLKARQAGLEETLEKLGRGLDDRTAAWSIAERELLAESRGQASQASLLLSEVVEGLEEFTRADEELSSRLRHEVLSSRLRPLADGVKGFPRLVRDLARELGKQARFEIVGETTGVDRDILDQLEAPLNHLIRNALDHGLEMPDERAAAGKAPGGTIRLEARHRAGMLQIILADDGRGIDIEKLRINVVSRGLTTGPIAARLNEAELLEFLFLPGFTTKDQVTEVSGRGVGLDVVASMAHAVKGTIRVSSRLGKGTRFILQLPITVSVIRALLVEIAAEPYAFPLNRIDRIFLLRREDVIELEGKPHAMVDGEPVGLVEATLVLDLKPEREREADALMPVVVASDRSHRFGVVVDRFLGERDLRVSPLDARLGKTPNINSSSVLENGWPTLVIDVEDMIRSIDNLLSGRRIGKLSSPARERSGRSVKRILVVDDSVTVRELERQLLEHKGYKVDTAVDGVDGWNSVRSGNYDLVVTDIDMPRMDGIQLVRHIKDDPRLGSMPVVVVSYKDREEDRIRGLDAGASAYLTKSSFHDQTFLHTIADLIGEPRELS